MQLAAEPQHHPAVSGPTSSQTRISGEGWDPWQATVPLACRPVSWAVPFSSFAQYLMMCSVGLGAGRLWEVQKAQKLLFSASWNIQQEFYWLIPVSPLLLIASGRAFTLHRNPHPHFQQRDCSTPRFTHSACCRIWVFPRSLPTSHDLTLLCLGNLTKWHE